MSAAEIMELMCEEDQRMLAAVRAALPQLSTASEMLAVAIRDTKRIVFVGAGTSGRIAAMEAAEWRPTFGVGEEQARAVVAGGSPSLASSVEGAEDDQEAAREAVRLAVLADGGVPGCIVAVSASGETPFTVAGADEGRRLGMKVIGVACNPGSSLLRAADCPVLLDTGPEVVRGSTRLKAGTAQKIALNMISVAAMCAAGRVLGDRMSHMTPVNRKLRDRAISIVSETLGIDRGAAEERLTNCDWNLPAALGVTRE